MVAQTLSRKRTIPLLAAARHRSRQILPGSASSRIRRSSSDRDATASRAASNFARTARASEDGRGSKGYRLSGPAESMRDEVERSRRMEATRSMPARDCEGDKGRQRETGMKHEGSTYLVACFWYSTHAKLLDSGAKRPETKLRSYSRERVALRAARRRLSVTARASPTLQLTCSHPLRPP